MATFIEYKQDSIGQGDTYASSTDACCWHCTFPFQGVPKACPVRFVSVRNTWTVVGVFCSWECTKSWQQIRAPYNTPIQRMWLIHLAREKFGYNKSIIYPAPGKSSNITLDISSFLLSNTLSHYNTDPWILKRFGGTLSIEEFRALSDANEPCETLHPPLLPACMAIVRGNTSGVTRNLAATRNDLKAEENDKTEVVSQKGLYEKFINEKPQKKKKSPEQSTTSKPKKKQGRAKNTSARGNLTGFMKRTDD